uniref:Uncharacterized protein n=1 Tax=Oryza nivara TaxID=4536 RepID=A0A0E0HWF6_ORYNI
MHISAETAAAEEEARGWRGERGGEASGGGITMLQRIGARMATACLAMVVAALVEARRLRVARNNGQVDRPDAATTCLTMVVVALVEARRLRMARDAAALASSAAHPPPPRCRRSSPPPHPAAARLLRRTPPPLVSSAAHCRRSPPPPHPAAAPCRPPTSMRIPIKTREKNIVPNEPTIDQGLMKIRQGIDEIGALMMHGSEIHVVAQRSGELDDPNDLDGEGATVDA